MSPYPRVEEAPLRCPHCGRAGTVQVPATLELPVGMLVFVRALRRAGRHDEAAALERALTKRMSERTDDYLGEVAQAYAAAGWTVSPFRDLAGVRCPDCGRWFGRDAERIEARTKEG